MRSICKFELLFLIGIMSFGVNHTADAQPVKNAKGVLYSIEIAEFTNLNDAVKFINKLPLNLKKTAYISTDNKIYRVRIYLLSSKKRINRILNQIDKAKFKGKIVTTPDYFLYSVQVITVSTRLQAEKVFDSLPPNLKKSAFLYLTDSGYYTIRLFKEKTRKEALIKLRKVREIFKDAVVVPTSPLKLKIQKQEEKVQEKPSLQQEKKIVSKEVTPSPKPEAIIIVASEIPKKPEKRTELKLNMLSEKDLRNELKLQQKEEEKEKKIIKKKLKLILEQSEQILQKEKKEKVLKKRISEKAEIVKPEKEPIERHILSSVSLFPLIDRTVNISGSWSYTFQEENEEERTSSFLQSYNINTPGEITDAIKYNLSYLFTKTSSSDNTWQKTSTPSAGLRLTNDIFSSSLTGMWKKSDTSEGDEVSSNNYNLTFSSNWSAKYPYLNAAASKSETESDSTNTQNISQRISTGYIFKNNISVNYGFSHSKTEDNERDSFVENYNHSLNIAAKKSFFNGKFLLSFSEAIYFSDSKYSVKSVNGTTYIPVENLAALSDIDTTPDLGTLTINGLLTDKDYSTSAGINLQNPYVNIAIESDYKKVDLISIYIAGNYTDTDINSLSWNLYTSDDGNIWNLQQIDTPFFYDNQTETLNFRIPTIYTRYIKLVLTSTNALNPIYVTETEAFEESAFTSESIVSTSKTGDTTRLNARVELPFKVNYSFAFERTSSDWEELSKKFTHNLSKSWKYKFYLISAGASRTDYFMTDLPTKSSQSFSLNVKASPLPTLFLRTGASYITNYTDFKKTSTTIVISSGANAKLFTGLNTKLTSDIIHSINEDTGESSTSFNTRFDVDAKLYPSLSVSSSLQHNISPDVTTDIVSLSSTWTPSDIIRVSLSHGIIIQSDGEKHSTTGLLASIVPKGGDIKYNFGVSLYNGETSYKGSIYWQVSDQLNAGSYLKYETPSDILSGGANMNARW